MHCVSALEISLKLLRLNINKTIDIGLEIRSKEKTIEVKVDD